MDQTLINYRLFNGLSINEIEDLLFSVPHKNSKYKKDEIIVTTGKKVTGQYILVKGSVRGEMIDFSGKIIKIEDIESPRMLAPAFLFGENDTFPVDIIANNDVELIFFYKDSFIKVLQLNQIVLMNYLYIISNRAHFLSKKIKFLSFQTIKGKYAHYLISLVKQSNKNELILPLSQSKLADLFGVTRPALSRAIRELNNDNIIHADGKNIKILDKTKLVEFMK